MRLCRAVGPAVLTAILLGGSGCEPAPDSSHPAFIKARQCRDAGDCDAARRQLLRFLDARPDSAEGHLMMASLSDENLNDPLLAIYHYRRYLELAPQAGDRETVQRWLEAAESRYREMLNGRELPPPRGVAETARIQELTVSLASERQVRADLQMRNDEFKRIIFRQQSEINQLRGAARREKEAAATEVAAPAPVVRPAPTEEKPRKFPVVYQVAPGDSLGAIARKFYGSSAKYRQIMDVNNLTEKSRLQVGQELMIPPLQ